MIALRNLVTVAPHGASAAKQPRLIQSTLQVSSTGHTKQQENDAAITKFVIGTNSPFVIAENANFRRLVDIAALCGSCVVVEI